MLNTQSEAFVYSWKNLTSGRIYVGYHKGTETDGYVCSSRSLLEEYHLNPSNFERHIIAHGSAADMRSLEQAILSSVDAKNNPDFYNMSNGCSDFVMKAHTLESKAKIGLANRGRVLSEQSRKNMSAGRTGKTFSKRGPRSDEDKAKISAGRLGKGKGPNQNRSAAITKWWESRRHNKQKL